MSKPARCSWLPWTVGLISLLFVISFSTPCRTIPYNPSLFPSYDVLNPGPAVRLNPLGISVPGANGAVEIAWDKTAEGQSRIGLFIVNKDFLMWVYELKAEVLELRKGLKK